MISMSLSWLFPCGSFMVLMSLFWSKEAADPVSKIENTSQREKDCSLKCDNNTNRY